MSLGDEWTEATAGSASKLNQVTLTYGTGAYLATLDKTKHKLVICTSTGSGFTIDHAYMASADATEWLDLSDTNNHFHTSTVGDGGSFMDIITGNANVMDTGTSLLQSVSSSASPWQPGLSGTGANTNQVDGTTGEMYIELDTGGTTASTVQQYIPINLSVDMTQGSKFSAKQQIQTATSIAIKCGIGMESLAFADSNTRKYGAECCTTVNNNWFAASANGTTRSSSDTGIAFTTNKRSIIGICNPTEPKMDLYVEESSLYTKTSNIPTTSNGNEPSRGAIFRYSVKNNTGASRKFNWYGARIIYVVNDTALWF